MLPTTMRITSVHELLIAMARHERGVEARMPQKQTARAHRIAARGEQIALRSASYWPAEEDAGIVNT